MEHVNMKSLIMLVAVGLGLIGGACFAASSLDVRFSYDDNLSIRVAPPATQRLDDTTEIKIIRPNHVSVDPGLLASVALVIDQESGGVLFEKNADVAQPIASITKLMTAIVVLEAGQHLDQLLAVTSADAAIARPTHSRLKIGAKLTRAELLRLMLMASENRAAAVLAQAYPGGLTNFIRRMNDTALAIGLTSTRFADPTGLDVANVSTARDLALLVRHAYRFDTIRAYSTTPEYSVAMGRARKVVFHNTNRLTRKDDWAIGLSKTGFISAAGQCLVLQASVVILDSWGKCGRIDDAVRLRSWLERDAQHVVLAGT
jgi:serine-type D-Ala-D-Ala endopeptidase (penicillin-binding protein 7)